MGFVRADEFIAGLSAPPNLPHKSGKDRDEIVFVISGIVLPSFIPLIEARPRVL